MDLNFGLKNPQSQQEFLHTNGLGSSCSGLVNGGWSRRYHGLLCASLNPPVERFIMVNHLVEKVSVEGVSHDLSQEFYLKNHEKSSKFIPFFSAAPFPEWQFMNQWFQLHKKVWMTPEENTTNVRYTNKGKQPLILNLKPLMGLRDYHSLSTNNTNVTNTIQGQYCRVESGLPSVFLHSSKGIWSRTNHWYYECFYAEEKHRGYDFKADLYNPAQIEIELAPQESVTLQLSLEAKPADADKSLKTVEQKYARLSKYHLPEWGTDVVSSAHAFLVGRESTATKTILAGYPWFTDWGRDTLICLRSFKYFLEKPVLESIILAFLKYEKNGLIPNRFPDKKDDKIEYNTVDATLWLFVVIFEIFDSKTDQKILKALCPTLKKIINAHVNGTSFGIKCDAKTGFLQSGEIGQQLTWMDARIGHKVITPRAGYAVEIQALWYNALKIYQNLSGSDEFENLSHNLEKHFEKHFWSPQTKGLHDVLTTDLVPDFKIRPNQIFVLSLPFCLLSKAKATSLIKTVEKHLKTPLGLRTLAPNDVAFEPHYKGNQWDRDHAYHQGTVWPFLMSEYWRAIENHTDLSTTKSQIEKDISPFIHHFYHEEGLYGVSEVFDGLSPKAGKGCPYQAWSTAMMVYAAFKLKEA